MTSSEIQDVKLHRDKPLFLWRGVLYMVVYILALVSVDLKRNELYMDLFQDMAVLAIGLSKILSM